MKRNLFQRLSACCVRRGALSALLAGGLLAACSDDPADGGQGRPLAEGEYPVVLTAAVEKATRATADDAWTGGEQVAVEAMPNPAGAQPEVKTYTADGDGRLTSDAPFWWTNSAERKTLRAWYCGDGSTAAGKANASAVPTAWSVAADQSGEGYQWSDLLFAPATPATFAGDAAVPLKFYHQTAKVAVNIRNAEAVTEAAQLKAVRIGDGDLILTASFIAPAAGATAGTWTTDGIAAGGTVTPCKLAAPSDADKYVATYEALVIPQPTAKKRMVAVETDFGTMYYTAPDDAAPLAAGKVRTYNITVYADRLEVSVSNDGGAWTASDSEEVTSKYLVASYTADELKIGDYFYSDGTTSDGGLRERWSDGSLKMADPKPAPETGDDKTVVGIVFQTDPSRIGEAEKTALADKGFDEPHGLVMAVKNAGTWKEWGPYGINESLTNCNTKAQNYNDISGYGNCELIRKNHTNFDSYPAFKAAYDYNTTCSVPETTTGWYLPASGQWWDILQNLGGCPVLAKTDEQTSSNSGTFEWSGQGDVPAALNNWMANIAYGSKSAFGSGDCLSSSSENSYDRACSWKVNSGGVIGCYMYGKNFDECDVRPVLAF